ncbi:unnamed protein product [Parnassius apollo]|uniref:(apollo) hypothetical protein n=1 Tax=Parnassius apollo TaxID=110799 RepID=A0A8S3Y1M4_PARAO|nr:unnamed protein product [Parnassius apollo]
MALSLYGNESPTKEDNNVCSSPSHKIDNEPDARACICKHKQNTQILKEEEILPQAKQVCDSEACAKETTDVNVFTSSTRPAQIMFNESRSSVELISTMENKYMNSDNILAQKLSFAETTKAGNK